MKEWEKTTLTGPESSAISALERLHWARFEDISSPDIIYAAGDVVSQMEQILS